MLSSGPSWVFSDERLAFLARKTGFRVHTPPKLPPLFQK